MGSMGSDQAFSGVIGTRSLEEHQSAMRGTWALRARPLAAKPMRSKLVYLRTPNILIYREQWGPPFHLRGELRRGRIAFALPKTDGVPFSLLGRRLDPHVLPWMAASGELDIVTRRHFDNVILVFDESFLRLIAAQVGDPFAEGLLPEQPTASLCRLVNARSLRRKVERILAHVEENANGNWLRSVLRSRLDQRVADALLDALHTESGEARPLTPTQRYRLVKKCFDYAKSVNFDLTIPELCAEVRTSRRTLEYAFREANGTSPARYFQLCRLREAFLELARSSQKTVDVTTVATNWGFYDLGGFARDFRASFGELPSETLKRDSGRSPSMAGLVAG